MFLKITWEERSVLVGFFLLTTLFYNLILSFANSIRNILHRLVICNQVPHD